MLTATEHIRKIFERNGIEYSASQVVDDLAEKGVKATVQLVYNVRSDLRNQTNLQNYSPTSENQKTQKTLQQTVEEVISQSETPLSVSEIANEVKKTYFTKSHNFYHMVRIECYRLQKKFKITPVYEGRYVKYIKTTTWINNLELPKIPEPIKPKLSTVIENFRKLQDLIELMGNIESLQKHLDILKKIPISEFLIAEKVIKALSEGTNNV